MEHCYASSIDANGKPHRCMLEVHHSGDHQFPCGAVAPATGSTCTLPKGHTEWHENRERAVTWPTDEAEAAAKPLSQEIQEVLIDAQPAVEKRQYSHYFKDVSKFDVIDVYRVLALWEVTDPCIQHALKKLLCAGQRGAKDVIKDIKEVIVSCERFLEMQTENEK